MENYGFSDIRDVVEVRWKIPRRFFYLNYKNGNSLKSPEFFLNDAKFCIEVYPQGDIGAQAGQISLFLRFLKGSGETNLSWNFKLIVGTFVRERKTTTVFVDEQFEDWGWKNFASRIEILSCGGSFAEMLTISCRAYVLKSPSSKNDSQETVDLTSQSSASLALKTSVDVASQNLDLPLLISEKRRDLENLAQDLEKFFLCTDFSDVKVIVREKEFSAHKLVLCFRSPVFLAMFQHDMAESNTGIIKIDDMNPEFFKDFLLFIYSGKFHCVTTKNAIELYKAADKYCVKGLKEKCVFKMKESMSLETILDTLYVANSYEEESLLNLAMQFFIKNAEAICETNAWEDFFLQKENSKLTKELMLRITKKKTKHEKPEIDTAF